MTVLCPSPGCQIRVRIITSESESESESSPQSPSPNPSHHLRVRVRESESKKNLSPSHESSSPHIQHLFIFQNMKTNNKNVSNVRVNSATARPLLLGLGRALGPESRVTISESESESESKWKKLDSSPSPYSSHTALVCMTCVCTCAQVYCIQMLPCRVQRIHHNWWLFSCQTCGIQRTKEICLVGYTEE